MHMDTKTTIMSIAIIVVLILMLVFQNRLSRLARKTILFLSPSESLSQVMFTGFLFFAAIISALYISNATEMVNMTTLWIVMLGFLFVALASALRIKMQSKDTMPEKLADEVSKLAKQITKLVGEIKNLSEKIDKK